MSTNLVIVAIPEETDRVWKISSEKVPHLTLLFLGEVENNPHVAQIVQFVQHAVELSEHGQFYLDVDYRSTLGDAEADVLYFSKRSWNLKWIKQFRGQLLQNQQIRSAYDAVPQHTAPQDWLPHLTLGYPDTPAKPLPDDGFEHPIYSVCFDRIAVWTEDSDGPEFRLEWPDRELEGDLAIAYSDTQKAALMHNGQLLGSVATTQSERGEQFVEHHGIKGMKWGVTTKRGRNAENVKNVAPKIASGAKAVGRTLKKGAKGAGNLAVKIGDAHFEGKASDAKTFMRVHNRAAEKFNSIDIPKINDKAEYRNANFNVLGPQAKLTRQYESEMANAFQSRLEQAVKSEGSNWSGTRKLEIDGSFASPEGWGLKVADTGKAKHAADDSTILVRLKRDAKGFITDVADLELIDNTGTSTVDHGEAFVDGLVHAQLNPAEEFVLEHYGVKGMRWGQRNSGLSISALRRPPQAVAPHAESKVPHGKRRKTKVEVDGGENHPASEDAIKVAQAHAKLVRSGPKALSNQELRDVATRVQLEQQAIQASRPSASKWIRGLLKNQGNQAVNQVIKSEVDSKIKSK